MAAGKSVVEGGEALLASLRKLAKQYGVSLTKSGSAAEQMAELKTAGVPGTDLRALRGILTTPDLRDMSFDNALSVARLQPHLFKDSASQYIGGPRGMDTRQALTNMRRALDKDIEGGAAGGDWYDRSRDFNKEIAGPDPARQSLAAQEQALWSAQANPDTNMNFALQGHNAYELGTPLDRVRSGQQARTYSKARDNGSTVQLGPKTDIFRRHLDPTVDNPPVGTNDIWHARSMGYTNPGGEPFSRGLSSQEHRFMDYETVLAADRANQNTRGGIENWTGDKAQAAAWVYKKGQQIAEQRGIPIEQGVAEAAKTYPDYADKYTLNATHEQMPYSESGHFPDLFQASEAQRDAFSQDPRRAWGDEHGRDEMYDALGFYQRPMLEARGVWTPPSGETEFNVAGVSRPLVGLRPADKGAGMDDASRHGAEIAEGWRALLDAQGAGAAHIHDLRPAIKVRDRNALMVPNEGGTDPEMLKRSIELFKKYGLNDVSDTGRAVTATNFGADPNGTQLNKMLKRTPMLDELASIYPGAVPRLSKVDSVFMPTYMEDTVPGSGELTRRMLDLTGPELLAKLDRSAALRSKIGTKKAADAERAAATGAPYRQDLQNLREIISDPSQGFSKLREALSNGVPLPGVMLGGAGLGQYLSEDDSGT